MELRMKKDGTIYLLNKEIAKASHTLENVRKVVIVLAGKTVKTTELDVPSELEEIGLDVYIV